LPPLSSYQPSLKSSAIIKSIRPRLRKILLYSGQLVTLNFERFHEELNGFFFGDLM